MPTWLVRAVPRRNAGITDSIPTKATKRRVLGGSGRFRSRRSTNHIATSAGMAPATATCRLALTWAEYAASGGWLDTSVQPVDSSKVVPPEPTAAPTRVGRYEVITHLATGGMAQIYLARQ